uniref:Zinc_ribbon_16 domain-containing protein n=2 Tax=Bursaphelenchus xylophilus TaxID=6326 RepID=A0A1I7SUG9_BURXY
MSKRPVTAKTPAQPTGQSRRMDPIEEELQDAGSSASTPPAQMVASELSQTIPRTSSSTAIHRIDHKRPSSLKDRSNFVNHKPLPFPTGNNHSNPLTSVQTTAINHSTSISELFMNVPFSDSTNPEVLSPASYEYKKNKKIVNTFDSTVQFFNSPELDFFIVSKDDFQIYKMEYELDYEPVVELFREQKFRSCQTDPIEYTCQCVALDNTVFNNIAFGFNNGDIFVTSAFSEGEPGRDWYNEYHIRMNHKCEALVHLAWDKSKNGKGYLCAAYERGRGNEHLINLFDINQGQQRDLFCERQLSETIHDITFLDLELTTLMVSCSKNFRFIDIRERTGFMNITSVNVPLLKVAFEPYNNVQFAGVNGNDVTIYDRRFLSKALYEFEVGPKDLKITNISYNPNRYCNISCSSTSSGIVYDLDVSPAVAYSDHMAEGKTVDAMKQAVTRYAQKFSYGVNEINTSLKQVQDFTWSHNEENLLLVIPPKLEIVEDQEIPDQLLFKTVVVDHNRNNACFPPDGSIVFCSANSVERIKPKPRVHTQRKKAVGFCDSNDPESPTECEKIEAECIGRLHSEDGRVRVRDIQHHLPFRGTHSGASNTVIEKDLQLWFARGDINRTSYSRALKGYGFGRTAGSARALIENSDRAIRDDKDESDCLKECWKLLIRIYIIEASHRVQQKYGTLFPGVHRLARKMKSSTMVKDDPVTFRNRYYLSKNRDDILRTCGWTSLDDHNGLATRLERLMNTNNVEDKFRAATMAMFALQGPACKTYLNKTVEYLRMVEFTANHSPFMIQRYQHMVDLVIKALETYDGIRIQNYDSLLREIDQPYLMAMVRFIGRRQHTYLLMQREIMAINGMSVSDRIAFAAIHMDDQVFKESLSRLNSMVLKSDNPLSVLLISGLDDHKQSHIAIQTYLEQTNDIQTAALLLCAGNCFRRSKIWESYDMRKSVRERITIAITKNALKNTRKYSLQIVLQYMQWLQASQLILQKSFIMTFLRKKLEFPKTDVEVKAKLAQSIIACNFCGKPILPYISGEDSMFVQKTNNQRKMGPPGSTSGQRNAHPPPPRTNGCPHHDCSKPLPCCTICKKSCNQQVDVHSITMHMDDWFIWCTKCCHGGHLKHLREWFDNYDLCPSGGCDCECPKLDTVFKASVRSKKKVAKEVDILEGTKLRTITGYLQPIDDEDVEEEQLRILKRLASREGKAPSSQSTIKRNRRKSSTKPLQRLDPESQPPLYHPMIPEVVLSGFIAQEVQRTASNVGLSSDETDDECDTLKADSPRDEVYEPSSSLDLARPKRRVPDKRSISECITDESCGDTKPRSNSSLEEKNAGYIKWPYVTRNFWPIKSAVSTESQIRPNLPGGHNLSQEKSVNQKLVQAKKAPANAKFSEHIFILPQKQRQSGYSTSIQRNRLHQAIVSQAIYEQVEVEQHQVVEQSQRLQWTDATHEVGDISSASEDEDEFKEVDKLVRYNQRVYNEAREHGKNQKKRTQKDLQNIRNKLGSPKQVQRKVSEPSRLPSKSTQQVSIQEDEIKAQSQSPNRKNPRFN